MLQRDGSLSDGHDIRRRPRVREAMKMALPADTFANLVVFAMSQPDDFDINEIFFRPVSQEL